MTAVWVVSFRHNDEDRVLDSAWTHEEWAQQRAHFIEHAYGCTADIDETVLDGDPND